MREAEKIAVEIDGIGLGGITERLVALRGIAPALAEEWY